MTICPNEHRLYQRDWYFGLNNNNNYSTTTIEQQQLFNKNYSTKTIEQQHQIDPF